MRLFAVLKSGALLFHGRLCSYMDDAEWPNDFGSSSFSGRNHNLMDECGFRPKPFSARAFSCRSLNDFANHNRTKV